MKDFVLLFQRSIRLVMVIDRIKPPSDLHSAWLHYATTLMLTREALKDASGRFNPLPTSPKPLASPRISPPLSSWAKSTEARINELLDSYQTSTAEGAEVHRELERLREDVRIFQNEATRRADLPWLAFRFRFVDEGWRRLVRRSKRAYKVGEGPNATQLQRIGAALAPIHANLGIPSDSPFIELN